MKKAAQDVHDLLQTVVELCESAREETAALEAVEAVVGQAALSWLRKTHEDELDLLQTLLLRAERVRQSLPLS